ncbi:Gfo/Idh/MocA family protein [Legionella sp. CNM-4043-24]|uniref:Gfo/Idh/MocA family protein n=1 Tax=Legionella sp. CNM-4043-24 TaxID=3421646 RepID=UPI00403AB48D
MSKTPWVITDRKINVAVVGCGRIANNHLQAIEQLGDHLQLTAVCDVDSQALRDASTRCKVPGFASLEQMLKESEADIVTLCTPSGLHPEQSIQVAQSGRHIITEKPMATRWQDGLRMVKACDAAGVRLFVVKQNRLNSTMQALKRAIEQKRFGRIHMASVNVFWTRPQEYYDQGGWRGTWEMDGGAFMNQASHYVDLIQWLLGPVDSVQAMMATLERDIAAEDSGVMTLRFRHGAMASINVTMLTYPKNFEGSITILGEKGTVRIGGVAVNEVQHWEFADARPEDEAIRQASYQTASVYGFGHQLYYQNVIDCLRGEARPITDGRAGLVSLELLIAAYRAARDRQTVYLPLEL